MIRLWDFYATVLAQQPAYSEAQLISLEHFQFKQLPLPQFVSAAFHSAFSSSAIRTSAAFPHSAAHSIEPLTYLFIRFHASSPLHSSQGYLFAY
jgi:hypothetical protein